MWPGTGALTDTFLALGRYNLCLIWGIQNHFLKKLLLLCLMGSRLLGAFSWKVVQCDGYNKHGCWWWWRRVDCLVSNPNGATYCMNFAKTHVLSEPPFPAVFHGDNHNRSCLLADGRTEWVMGVPFQQRLACNKDSVNVCSSSAKSRASVPEPKAACRPACFYFHKALLDLLKLVAIIVKSLDFTWKKKRKICLQKSDNLVTLPLLVV